MVIIDHDNKEVDVWEISTSSDKPDWVKEAFQKNILQWKDQRLRILMPALYPKWSKRSEYYGYGMYVFGDIGDIIDKTNGKVIRQSFFEKHYQLLNDE